MSVKINQSASDVDSWLNSPMTQLYLRHLSRHAEGYKKELISGITLSKPESALISTAKIVGAIEALESKQQMIFFDMKRELSDDRSNE